jgi:molecular chaperone Hsp33
LAYRLFHERGVRVFRSAALAAQCSCSRAGVANMLRSFPQDDRDHMVENGVITVTCEFCNSSYVFEPADVEDQESGSEARAQESQTAPPGLTTDS